MTESIYLSLSESGFEETTETTSVVEMEMEKSELLCEFSILYMRFWCSDGHDDIRPLRCHKCTNCMQLRKNHFVQQALLRYTENSFKKNELVLWTLGTNLDDTEMNRFWIKLWWKVFRKSICKLNMLDYEDQSWQPLVYVIEVGSQGGKLHVHFINNGVKLDQIEVKSLWSWITDVENPNASFSRLKECVKCGWTQDYYNSPRFCLRTRCDSTKFKVPDAKKALLYLSKYLSKDKSTGNYYWMGHMRVLEVEVEKYVFTCPVKMFNGRRCDASIWLIELGTKNIKDEFDPTVMLPQLGTRKYQDISEVYEREDLFN